MKVRICHFCHSGLEHTTVKIAKRFYPICYLCNRDKKHIKNKWEIKLLNGWRYKFFEDKFVREDGFEVGRLAFLAIICKKIL